MKKFGIISFIVGSTFFFFLLFPVSRLHANNRTNDTVAVINGNCITAEAFKKSYNAKRMRYGFQDNLEMREGYLRNIVNDELLIAKAKREKLHTMPESVEEYNRIYTQELVNAYAEKYILHNIKVTENELKEFYRRFNTKIKVRHLYAKTKQEADSLYKLIGEGKTFEELARQTFTDPRLRESGGLLGYVGVDEMDPNFENTAFTLQIGEVSRPVRTVQGYSIIRVEDIQGNPFLTESEYAKKREKLQLYVQRRKNIEALQNFTRQYRALIRLKFDQKLLDKLFQMFSASLADEKNFLTNSEQTKIAVSSTVGNWTVKKVYEMLRTTKASHQKWIHTKEDFEDFLAGLFIQQEIAKKAKKEQLDRVPEFQEKVKYAFDSYLLSTIEKKMKSEIAISRDSLYSFYLHNKELFRDEPEIRLRSILLNNALTADSVMRLLSEGKNFSELAQKYSIQHYALVNGGDIGYFKYRDLGDLADDIFTLDVGEWRGPFIRDDMYLFVSCVERRSSSVKRFNDVAGEIEKMLVELSWQTVREQKVNELKKEIDCRIYSERLKSLTF